MAVIITEPLGETINYTEWARLIQKTTLEAGGFMALGLTNMNNTGAPQIANGSRVEVGGSLYKCMADETIGGTAAAGVCYIYCNPAGSAAGFTYSATAPQWNAVKGGWYNGNSRAVAKLFYTSGQYNGKVILDGYNAIRAVNAEQAVPETDGVLFASAGVNTETIINLPPGAYRVDIKGGKGGKGGNTTFNEMVDGYGGDGADGESVSVSIITKGTETAVISAGGDGENGSNGGEYDGAGGGGGGCSGGMSYAIVRGLLYKAFGGSGGGGSTGWYDTIDGGGGGGYGQGKAGDNHGRTGGEGKGGNNGKGGAGGKGGEYGGNGGGGSGYGGGGTSPSTGYAGKNGGGYGAAGGDGGGGVSHSAGDVVGKGGSSQNMTGGLNRTFNNLFQGGGGGGKAADGNGGNGGGGLKSASSGYVRIFRMW